MRLLIILATLSVTSWAADNSIGTWKRNEEKSKFVGSHSTAGLTSVREAIPGGVKVTNTVFMKDGTESKHTYTAKYDGVLVPVSGGVPNQMMAIKQIDANTFAITMKTTNRLGTSQLRVAEDGKSYTNTVPGTDKDGKPFTNVWVFEKQ